MNNSYYGIALDIKSVQSQVTFPVKQGDTSRGIKIILTDGGKAYAIERNCSATFKGKKSDGKKIKNICTIENNRIIYHITEQTVASPGIVDCEVSLFDPNGNLITTPRFTLIVDSRVDDDEYESTDEYTTFETTLSEVGKAELERQANEIARQNALATTINKNSTHEQFASARATYEHGESIRAEILPILNTIQGENNVTEVNVWELETGIYRIIGSFNYMQGEEFIPYETVGGVGFATTGVLIVAKNNWDVSWVFIGVTAIKGYQYYRGEVKVDGSNGSYTKILQSGGGTDGQDGVSVTHSWNGTTLTVTSASGTSSADLKGDTGDTGASGSDGKDGTSVTVSKVTESTADGGSNVVTFSDGKTLTVKNGKNGTNGKDGKNAYQIALDNGFEGTEAEWLESLNGSDGFSPIARVEQADNGANITITDKNETTNATVLNGKDGYTPKKGVDYYTEEDKAEMVNDVKNVCVARNQGSENVGKILVVGTDGNLTLANMPEGGASGDVIGVLDESNNILLSGNLSDGKYTLKYENTDGTYMEVGELVIGEIEPPKTNFFVVGGDGYLNPGRSSGKGEDRTDVTSCLLSNYIEVQYGDIVYVEGLVLGTNAASFSGIYKTDKSGGVGITIATDTTYLQDTALSENGGQFTIKWANAGFIRICGVIPSDINAVKVTIKRNGEWL